MPVYEYKCRACQRMKEVVHLMSEVDEPSQELLEEISCHLDRECLAIWNSVLGIELPSEEDLIFQRVPQAITIKGSYGGSSVSGAEKRATIQKERKKRSSKDFNKNIYPTLPKAEKKWFDKKKK